MRRLWIVLLAFGSGAVNLAFAQFDAGGERFASVRFVEPAIPVVAGRTFTATMLFRIAPRWHIGWRQAGVVGLPTRIDFELPAGVQLLEQRWSLPHYLSPGDLESGWVYSEQAQIRLLFQAPQSFTAAAELKVQATFLVCEEICLSGKSVATARLIPAAAAGPPGQVAGTAVVFEEPWAQLKENVVFQDVGPGLRVTFKQVPGIPAAVEVFYESSAVDSFTASEEAGRLEVTLVKGPTYTSASDILIVVRGAAQSPVGVQLSSQLRR